MATQQWAFRHSALNLPLMDSIKASSVGFAVGEVEHYALLLSTQGRGHAR